MTLRVLVCGGRDYADREHVYLVLDLLHRRVGVAVLIQGEARGADTLAREWAEARGVPVLPFPADWTRHGRFAGPRRNQRMLDEGRPGLVLAFPGGRGTMDMTRRARRAGVRVISVRGRT